MLIIKQCENKDKFDRTLSENEAYAQLIKRTTVLNLFETFSSQSVVGFDKKIN